MKFNQSRFYYEFTLIAFLVFSCSDKELDEIESRTEVPLQSIKAPDPKVFKLTNDVLFEWARLHYTLDTYTTGRPNVPARAAGYIYLAAYETAVRGMSGYTTTENRYPDLDIDQSLLGNGKPKDISWELALNKCFSLTLEHFLFPLPGFAGTVSAEVLALHDSLRVVYTADISTGMISDSEDWGTHVANQVIAFSQTDLQAEQQMLDPQPLSYIPPVGPGFWTFTDPLERALFPFWGLTRTFAVDPDEIATVDPIPYSEATNSDYYAQMFEVFTEKNSAANGDGDKLWIAEFWSDDVEGFTMGPPIRQFAIANQLIDQFDLDLQEALVLFLKLGFAINDAAVVAWKNKYAFMVQRPSDYIRAFIDPNYQTNLFPFFNWPNPTFPGYPSGHSTFAGAGGGIFMDQFGDAINFTDSTHFGRTDFISTPRTYNSITAFAEENAFSRIPLGVHIRIDCEEGLREGYQVADVVNSINFRGGQGNGS